MSKFLTMNGQYELSFMPEKSHDFLW